MQKILKIQNKITGFSFYIRKGLLVQAVGRRRQEYKSTASPVQVGSRGGGGEGDYRKGYRNCKIF